MSKCVRIAVLGVAVLGFVVAVLPAADAPKSDPAADDVRHVAMAYDLAAYGRDVKSPEMLIAAARILKGIKPAPTSEKVTVTEGDKPGKFEEMKPIDLGDEATKLLNEAKELAKNDTVVNELIDRLQKEKGRGSLGGPKSWTNTIRVGGTHSFNVNMAQGQLATVSVTGNGVSVLTLSATNERGVTVASSTGRNPSISWVPVETRPFTITIHDDAGGPTGYTVYHN